MSVANRVPLTTRNGVLVSPRGFHVSSATPPGAGGTVLPGTGLLANYDVLAYVSLLTMTTAGLARF